MLGNDVQPFREEQYVTVALSTSGHAEALPIAETHWSEGGVPYESYVLPWAVHSPQREYVEERLGKLTESFVGRAVDVLFTYVRSQEDR